MNHVLKGMINKMFQYMFNLYSLRRFSVQFMTPTSPFTPSESNGLVYKPHLRFLAQNLSEKVRLIHECLWYFNDG